MGVTLSWQCKFYNFTRFADFAIECLNLKKECETKFKKGNAEKRGESKAEVQNNCSNVDKIKRVKYGTVFLRLGEKNNY